MRKSIKNVISCFLASVVMASSCCITSSASVKTYTKTFTRGKKPISWCRTTVQYTAKNSSKITKKDWWQDCGGIGVSAGGVKKLSRSSDMMCYLNAKTKFDASISKVLSFGLKRTWTDQLRFDCAGNFWGTKDV